MSIRLSGSVLPVSRVSSGEQSLLVPLQQIGDPVEQRGAFGHRGGGPFTVVEGFARGGDGIARVLGRCLVDDGGHAAVGRVDDLARPAVGGVTPFTADKEVGLRSCSSVASLPASAEIPPSGTLPTRGTPRCGVRQVRVHRRCR